MIQVPDWAKTFEEYTLCGKVDVIDIPYDPIRFVDGPTSHTLEPGDLTVNRDTGKVINMETSNPRQPHQSLDVTISLVTQDGEHPGSLRNILREGIPIQAVRLRPGVSWHGQQHGECYRQLMSALEAFNPNANHKVVYY